MTGKRKFPPHVGRSRAWKARKRRELAALEKAFKAVHLGCAYTPIGQVGLVQSEIAAWRHRCSAKEWGR